MTTREHPHSLDDESLSPSDTAESAPPSPPPAHRRATITLHETRSNSLFRRILAIVFVGHIAVFVALYYTGKLDYLRREVRVTVVPMPNAPPVQDKPLPAPPLGEVKQSPTTPVRQLPHPTPQPPSHTRAVATIAAPGEIGDIAPQEPTAPELSPSPDVDTKDVRDIAGSVAAVGPAAPGAAPAGFPNGRIDGRIYFIRLKHDIGNWYAHTEGVSALLEFMNRYFRCETENRPMTAAEIQQKYIAKGAVPSFIYLSCDGNFSLTTEEASILRGYIDSGGFLFLDSAPDEITRGVVAAQLGKVVPGARLAPISPSHPINRFLFRLAQPGIGENWSDARNYGITRGDRLVVFYSPGNLAHYYELAQGKSDDYSTAQFQMGANVVAYAINKGVQSAVQQRPGARGAITRSTLQGLGFLDRSSSPSPSAGKSPLKPRKIVPGKTPAQDEPADVKLVE